MLIAAIIGHRGKMQTASLINSILSPLGKKISIVDLKYLLDLDSNCAKSYIKELDRNNIDILILKINLHEIKKEIFDFLHFDISIYTDKADDLGRTNAEENINLMRRLSLLLDEKGIAIVNVDDIELIRLLHGMKHYIVTYGFNSKSSITTSSIGDTVSKDSFMCCLQRTITTTGGMLVEPQEYRISLEFNEVDAYSILAAAAFAIVTGADLSILNEIEVKV